MPFLVISLLIMILDLLFVLKFASAVLLPIVKELFIS